MITLINHQGLKMVKGIQIQSPSPSIGLAYIGSHLKSHGYDYTGIDACGLALDQAHPYPHLSEVMIQGVTNQEVVERIPKDTEIIGFTCLFSQYWPVVCNLLAMVKEAFPNALYVLGGEHGTSLPEECLRTGFDVVVVGEGEETFLELVQAHANRKDWKDLPGIACLKEGKFIDNGLRKRTTDIDGFPYPDWDSWCIEEYIAAHQVSGLNAGRTMPILGSRGCPYACKFCSSPQMWTRKYLMRSPAGLADEMEYMKTRYDVSGFVFMDSTFVIDRKKTLQFGKELIQRNTGVTYQLPAGTRFEAFDQELAHTLAESGLMNFAFAPESGSVEILKIIGKGCDLKQFIESVRVVLNTTMTVGCFIVIGFPEDTPTSLRATARMLRKLAWMGVHDVTVSKFTPYPGSVYYDELRDAGKVVPDNANLGMVMKFYSSSHRSFCESISSKSLHFWMIWLYYNFFIISFLLRPWRLISNFMVYFKTGGIEKTRYMRLFNELFANRKLWKTKQASSRLKRQPR